MRGACEGIGLATLYQDFGFVFKVKLSLDASAAKGIIERQGICKIRNLDVGNLWLQEQLARRLLPVSNVLGTKNPADLITKGLPDKTINICAHALYGFGYWSCKGCCLTTCYPR